MTTASDFMGDDGNGYCLGCNWPIDRFNAGCPVCIAVAETLHEWATTGIDPRVATVRLDAAIRAAKVPA